MTLAQETTVHPALALPQHTLRNWLLLWGAVILAEVLLLADNAALDTWLWRVTRWFVGDRDFYNWTQYHALHATDAVTPFYMTLEPPLHASLFKHTQHFWEVLRTFGEPWMTVLILLLLIVYGRRGWRTACIAAIAILSAGGLGALIRIITGRTRPTHIDAANQWLLFRGFHNGTDLSFPSGHATVAFATAGVLSCLSPKGRWIFLAVAAGCALSRVVMGAHFYADTLFGAALGWTLGWWITTLLDGWLTPKHQGISL